MDTVERLCYDASTKASLWERAKENIVLIADLRAVLAPLLDQPLIYVGAWAICKVCGDHTEEDRRPPAHLPGCAVLRKDELLGR